MAGSLGKTFAIMNSEQAHPRRCGIKPIGDALTFVLLMNRWDEELSCQDNNIWPDPIL